METVLLSALVQARVQEPKHTVLPQPVVVKSTVIALMLVHKRAQHVPRETVPPAVRATLLVNLSTISALETTACLIVMDKKLVRIQLLNVLVSNVHSSVMVQIIRMHVTQSNMIALVKTVV